MDKEASIDLREFMQIALQHKKIIVSIIVFCTMVAMFTAFFILPKTYESTTLVRAKSGSKLDLSGTSAAMAMLGGATAASPTTVYMELMKSRAVLDPLIQDLDIPEGKKENMSAKSFSKSNLDIKNVKGTDLLEITAKGKSPEEAQMISQRVVDGFLNLMTQMNQNEQSFMAKFLSVRIDTAKKTLDDASQKLEDFSQNKKIYVPEEQAKAELERMTAFDKAYGDLKVQEESAKAQFDSTTAQLGQQNAKLKEFNVADNETVQKIRNSIIDKQVELVTLEQQYQEKHPSVIAAKAELTALQASLNQEVSDYVAAGTVTMNPVQAEILKGKTLAETNIAVAQASISAVQAMQNKTEGDMSKLSADSLQYINLKREVSIDEEIYLTLVKNFETARIQETMDSMDIQIVDPADLPKKPTGPWKLLITAIGGTIGLMIAFGYTFVLYNKRHL
ncbi:GumC family protein [Propionispira raffinosivorans]|uniref:GumC family protein n=1 Tax=Propionispira raffinosivorans TaxID=86959 RepID=UPI000374C435|nr:GNVR domain-containing protein [Propionispira raffinosivorans]